MSTPDAFGPQPLTWSSGWCPRPAVRCYLYAWLHASVRKCFLRSDTQPTAQVLTAGQLLTEPRTEAAARVDRGNGSKQKPDCLPLGWEMPSGWSS